MTPWHIKIQGQEVYSNMILPTIGETMGAIAIMTETWLRTLSRTPLSSLSLAMAREMEDAAPAPIPWSILAQISIEIDPENAQSRLATMKRRMPLIRGGLRPKRSESGP